MIERIELASALVSHLGSARGEVGRGSRLGIAEVGYLLGHLGGPRLFREVMLVRLVSLRAQLLVSVHPTALAPVRCRHVQMREGPIVALPARIHTARASALRRAGPLWLRTHCLVRCAGLRSQGSGCVACRHVLRLYLVGILKLLSGAVLESNTRRGFAPRGLVVVDLVD